MLAHLFGILPWHIEGPEHLSYAELFEFVTAGNEMSEQLSGGS